MTNNALESGISQPEEPIFEPTGEKVDIQINGQPDEIVVYRQLTEEYCGDTSLAALRQPTTGEPPEEGGVSSFGVWMKIEGSDDVSEKVKQEGYPKVGPNQDTQIFMEWAKLRTTGRTHAYVVLAQPPHLAKPAQVTVINPQPEKGQSGIMPITVFHKKIVRDVEAVMRVPIGPKPLKA